MRLRLMFVFALAAMLAGPTTSKADLILDFAQLGVGNTTTITATGGTSTTITNTNTLVSIDAIGAALVTPFNAFFSLSAHSTSAVDTTVGVSQHFSGTFSFTSGMNDTGTNFLSGTFTDIALGTNGGTFLVLGATTPPAGDVTYTSSVMGPFLEPRSLALSLTAMNPAVHVDGTTIGSGTASISGDFSAVVPEPASIAQASVGFAMVGLAAWRRRRKRKHAV